MTQKQEILDILYEHIDGTQNSEMVTGWTTDYEALASDLEAYIAKHYISKDEILKALNSEEIVNVMIKMERERIKEALGIGEAE